MTIETLEAIVIKTLDFFIQNSPPSLDISSFSLPFVVGSGNAINTGNILFSGKAAIFADETNFRSTIEAYKQVIEKGLIKDAVIISASGEKDSVWEVELAKKYGLKTTLLTCKPESSAAKAADTTIAYKSIAEPYTYNTSTYLGMILSATKEDPSAIKSFIQNLATPYGFTEYESYAFVLPDALQPVAPMIIIKDNELFGPHVQIRAFSEGHARHAKFIHRWSKELVISLLPENQYFGDPDNRWNIELPKGFSFGAVIALTYYLCGLIQKAKPDYFAQHITGYCEDYGPKAYGKDGKFDVIVPANS